MIEFFVPLKKIPTVTHQEKKVTVVRGKPRFYEPAELKKVRALFMELFAPYRPDEPLDGPLRLTTKWLFPRIKGTYDGQYKHTKPDTENLLKLPKDCLQKLGFFVNDSRVASEITEKFWADTVGIYIKIEELKNEN